MTAKKRTLTLRLDEQEAFILDQYMARYTIKTASKAMMRAIELSMGLDDISNMQRREIATLKECNAVLASTLDNARAAAVQLLEQVGQGDMLVEDL